MPNKPLIEKYLQLIAEVITNHITDLHVGSGDFPYIRMTDRNVEPVESFGRLSYDDVIEIIHFMNPLFFAENLEKEIRGITFIYEIEGTRFRANVSKNNE